MTAQEMVKAYMREYGIAGLCNTECGCSVNDFPACGEVVAGCVSAVNRPCETQAEKDECPYLSGFCPGPCWRSDNRIADAGKGMEEEAC